MQIRFRPWHLALLLTVVSIAIVTLLTYLRMRSNSSVADLAARIPDGNNTVVYLDTGFLRELGLLELLAIPEAAEETEYREFVEDSGFDYTRDLNSVLASFHENEIFLLVRGRFNWRRLIKLATERGGDCYNGFCRLQGSEPNRRISFFAITPFLIAVAISRDEWAAYSLYEQKRDPVLNEIPEQPIWFTITGQQLSATDWLPAGARSFIAAMSEADRITLTLGAHESDFQVQFKADCQTSIQAKKLTAQLEGATQMLTSLIEQEKMTPNPEDLSGVLTEGSFDCEGVRVHGRWPIRREFLESMVSYPQ